MKISEFINLGINPATAYILGLCFPLLKEKQLSGHPNYYILGAVNHNTGKITDEELNAHFFKVSELIGEYIPQGFGDILVYNNSPIYGRIQPKEGFSVIMEKDMDEYYQELYNMVEMLKNNTENNKILFARGCFDGRSSFDTSRHYLSIDVDRDHQRQELIKEILQSLAIKINLNQREQNYDKNDQIRVEAKSIPYFYKKVGFYSLCRSNIIKKYIYGNSI